MEFKDYFSKQAEEYSKYRPKYPDELFKYLNSLTKEHDLAWDCACGNGQASIGLAGYYNKVIATDASPSQINFAFQHPKITYFKTPAENSGLESGSADIITAATAIHWIDTEKFYPEVKRILKPGGIIAVWNYTDSRITTEIDELMRYFSINIVDKYWPGENKKTRNFEAEINFPFNRIETPDFNMETEWTAEDYMKYLFTWSSVQQYIKINNINPVEIIKNKLIQLWGDKGFVRKLTWKLKIKAGRI